jgi:hypothetical protein
MNGFAADPTPPPVNASDRAAEERDGCIKNLRVIYEAIQAYQNDHKDIPNWLSDLVPQYLPDSNVLTCPVCRRTGQIEGPPLADPKISSSYLFEFCPVQLGSSAPNAPTHTRREWKRRQMGLVGSIVPIVRCRHHNPAINLSFDGKIFESPATWELSVTNRVPASELTAAKLFADIAPPPPKPTPTLRIPARDPKAGPGLLDLTKFYNATLTDAWQGETNKSLSALPRGLQEFGGIQFDVRGIIQLGSKSLTDKQFPPQVRAIPVHKKCRDLYFLHAVGFSSKTDEGAQVGSYVVHFAGDRARLEIPIHCGSDVRNWHVQPQEPAPQSGLNVAWTSESNPDKAQGPATRLFMTSWSNLAPDKEIESIDFVSSMAGPAPFLVAITAD